MFVIFERGDFFSVEALHSLVAKATKASTQRKVRKIRALQNVEKFSTRCIKVALNK